MIIKTDLNLTVKLKFNAELILFKKSALSSLEQFIHYLKAQNNIFKT